MNSCQHSEPYRVRRPLYGLLGYWLHHRMLWTGDIPGAGFLLPVQIRLGGRLLGTSVPTAEMVLPYGFRNPVGHPLL
jgi:hypothetical protein